MVIRYSFNAVYLNNIPGERLALPSNVRIMFEVQDLKYATLATVSRCGMVSIQLVLIAAFEGLNCVDTYKIWFSEEVLTTQTIFENYLATLRNVPFDEQEREQQLRAQVCSVLSKLVVVSEIFKGRCYYRNYGLACAKRMCWHYRTILWAWCPCHSSVGRSRKSAPHYGFH